MAKEPKNELSELKIALQALRSEASKKSIHQAALVLLGRAVAHAVPATTLDAKAKPRVKKANPQLAVARLKTTYEVLVRESDLANPSLSDGERLRRAGHLRLTYERLRKLDPSFNDAAEQLRLARNLLNRRNYHRGKAAKRGANTSRPSRLLAPVGHKM